MVSNSWTELITSFRHLGWHRRPHSVALCALLLLGAALPSIGCGASQVADLRPFLLSRPGEFTAGDGRPGDALADSARATLERARDAAGYEAWRQADEIEIEFVDHWGSTLFRQFTPLPRDDAALRLTFTPGRPGARLELLTRDEEASSEPQRVWSWSPTSDEPYRIDGQSDFWTGLYIESLRFYFEIPFLDAPYVAFYGWNRPPRAEWIQGIYVAPQGPDFAPDVNQRIVWIAPESGRISSVEFTYRAISDEYRGALDLSDYREQAGIQLPFRLAVGERRRDPRPFHVLRVKSVRVR